MQIVLELEAKTNEFTEEPSYMIIDLLTPVQKESNSLFVLQSGSELAQRLGLTYFECSCKDNAGVEDPLYYLASEMHKRHEEGADHIMGLAA